MAVSTSAGSTSGASATKKTLSKPSSCSSEATSIASRVFPLPPGPVSVSKRVSGCRRSATTSETSVDRPTNELVGRGREWLLVVAPRGGGKDFVAELEEPHRMPDVLEAMFAEIDHARFDELAGGLRDQDLPTRRDGADSRCAMHVDADVALVGQLGLAGVQPHAHPQGPIRERALRVERGGDRVRRCGEGREECVALGVDFHARMRLERFAQPTAMFGEHAGIAGAEGFQQSCRALDIAEQQGDGPSRQLSVWRARCRARLRRLESWVMVEDRAFQPLEVLARLEPERVAEQAVCLLVELERLGLSSGAVEREHELRARPLTQRVRDGERGQLPHQECLTAEVEVGLDALLHRDQARLFQAADGLCREGLL